VGLGHGSWAAHCGAGKRALAGGLGWPEQASRPGKQVERGLAGEGKEVELGLFLFLLLIIFFSSYSYFYTRKSYKLN
jgi:hypothetical protein